MDRRSGKISCLALGGIGCLAVVIAVVVSGVLLWSWLMSPAPLVPAEHYAEQQTRAFAVLRLTEDHAPYLAQADTLMEKAPMARGGEQMRNTDPEQLKKMLPLQVVVVLRPGEEDGEFQVAGAFAMSRFLRGITWAMRKAAGGSNDVVAWLDEDTPVVRSQEGDSLMTPLENTVFLTPDTELASLWVERHREALAQDGEDMPIPELDVPARLGAAYDRVSRDSMLIFASLNGEGELKYLVDKMDPELEPEEREALDQALENMLSVSGQVTPVDENTGEFKLFVECPDQEAAQQVEAVLRELSKDSEGTRDVSFKIGTGYDGAALLTVQGQMDDWLRKALPAEQQPADLAPQGSETEAAPIEAPAETEMSAP